MPVYYLRLFFLLVPFSGLGGFRHRNIQMNRFINEKGLASFETYMPSPALYVFYPSHEDMEEAVYSVNRTDIGVSIDQMIFISCMIDHNAQGGLGDAPFVDILRNNGNYIP